MNRKRLVLLLAASGLVLSAQGADLISVYRDALVSDPVYQSSRAQYQAGIEKLPQARAGYLPFVTATASAFRVNFDSTITPQIDYNTKSFGVTLSQPLFRWQNWIAISQAEQQLLQNEATFQTAKQDLILRVSQAYFDVLLAQDNVALSEAQKKAISEQLAQAKRNFEVGTATIVDTLEAQARFDQAAAKEIFDQNDLEVKKRALQQIVGKPANALTPLREPLPLVAPRPANIEEWVAASNDSSFSVAISRAALEIAKQEVDRTQAGHYPTLDLAATYTQSQNPISVL
jgi:outer membrane protein